MQNFCEKQNKTKVDIAADKMGQLIITKDKATNPGTKKSLPKQQQKCNILGTELEKNFPSRYGP